jgi:DNA-binding NarL/FixJ family response regulator
LESHKGFHGKEAVMKDSRILIVDDEREFVSDLEGNLRERSCEVFVAASREQAQEIARSKKPDMVVLGTIAPRGEAFRLHQWLRKSTQAKNASIIVVDVSPEKHLLKGWRRDEGMRLDADDYVARPIAVDALVDRIEKALDRTTEKITVLVADDHAVVRDGICALLALQRDMQVIGEAVDGKDAVEKALELLPDIVLMDIVMPRMNGLEATKQICDEYDRARVLILSQYDDQDNVNAGREAGAAGFIPKKSASSELVAGIRSVCAGKELVHPRAS